MVCAPESGVVQLAHAISAARGRLRGHAVREGGCLLGGTTASPGERPRGGCGRLRQEEGGRGESERPGVHAHAGATAGLDEDGLAVQSGAVSSALLLETELVGDLDGLD